MLRVNHCSLDDPELTDSMPDVKPRGFSCHVSSLIVQTRVSHCSLDDPELADSMPDVKSRGFSCPHHASSLIVQTRDRSV
jgi:hypothetical protein